MSTFDIIAHILYGLDEFGYSDGGNQAFIVFFVVRLIDNADNPAVSVDKDA